LTVSPIHDIKGTSQAKGEDLRLYPEKGENMEMIYLQPANVPKPAGEYSQGVKVKPGTLVVISGQVAWDVDGNLVGKGDIRAQSRQVFENLKNMLASAGATFKDVVKLGIFLKNREDFAAFREIRAQYFTPPFPPTTLLVVKSLAREEWLLEVEAMAVLD
jgi:reactive intermediate/imine deaminase